MSNAPKAILKNAWPYQDDPMNLPVGDVDAAVPFYEGVLGFTVESRNDAPHRSVVLERNGIRIGLAENGGDPTQDGMAFEVDSVEAAFAEFKSNGLDKEMSSYETEQQGETTWKVFYVVAPDGLCFWFGEREA